MNLMNNQADTNDTENSVLEVLHATQTLLDAIAAADWKTYETLCDESLTCFEPEARGVLVEGMDFHRYYFELGGAEGLHNTTMASPHVRVVGEDMAIVSYIRLVQHQPGGSGSETSRTEETRVWVRRPEGWRHVHFHRSAN